jgi:leucyl/phenylalanyl-tRNA--protein transferase
MSRDSRFPNPLDSQDPDGLIAVGGRLTAPFLLDAYRHGIFPWPAGELDENGEDYPLLWFCPPERAILEKEQLHIPRSLKRAQKSFREAGGRFTWDQAFPEVIRACAESPRPGQKGTWITDELVSGYLEFHRLGYAHSLEAWDAGGHLVGGIYGVEVDGVFSGESMFHRAPNVSKLALLEVMEWLSVRGLTWIDIQVMTPHLEALGARMLPRSAFLQKLHQTKKPGFSYFS